ncbi:unnamed protein product [Cuscuta campestris]|uniref:Uncharacterized protein n=1 Tax=Cuscuta campestris TaxID=132261 RepID=A0A484ME69_9ASTE|nr:unnamed protein product [Cuscuta campestris]
MNFRAFNIPTKKTGGSSSAAPRTVPVQLEPVEINSEEETSPTGRTTVNPPLDKGKGKVRTKHAATTHPSAKRRRGENVPASESLEELWVKMGQKLKEVKLPTAIAGRAKAETLQLKEENLKLVEDLELKEREFPGRAKQWVGENLEETARVITSTPEVTMEAFKFIYREPNGKEMVTQVGSYGFMSG